MKTYAQLLKEVRNFRIYGGPGPITGTLAGILEEAIKNLDAAQTPQDNLTPTKDHEEAVIKYLEGYGCQVEKTMSAFYYVKHSDWGAIACNDFARLAAFARGVGLGIQIVNIRNAASRDE